MAHYQQLQFVKELSFEYPEFFNNKSVLEIGSWITNGSVRDSFSECNYIGVDIANGPGVDIVNQGQNVDFDDTSFDTVISSECFEHNPYWKETFINMVRMLKPGGLCVITCATLGRKEHGTNRTNADASLTALHNTEEYYCNLREKDFRCAFKLDNTFSNYYFFLNVYSRDLYFFGFKKSVDQHAVHTTSQSLLKKIKAIKRLKKTSFPSNLMKHIKFWCSYIYALILGEKKYHDSKHKTSASLGHKSS